MVAGCSGGIPNTTAANVDGVSIDQKDYLDYLQQKATMVVQGPNGPVTLPLEGSPGFQALKDLVINKVIEKLAKDGGVLPTSQDVENEIKYRQQSNPNLITQAIGQGISLDMLREQIKVDLCKFNLVTKGITVTPAQVDGFVEENKAKLVNPPQAQLQMIVVKAADDQKPVDAALNQGKSFQTVAAAYSTDPNGRDSQYHYGVTDESKMPPALQALIAKTDVQHTTQWVKSNDGYVKFYVQSKTPATPMKITDLLKEQIKRQMMIQQGTKNVQLDVVVAKELLKDIDKIQVTGKGNGAQWKAFMANLQKSPINSMVSNAGTGTNPAAGAPTTAGSAPTGTAPASTGSAPAAGGASAPSTAGSTAGH